MDGGRKESCSAIPITSLHALKEGSNYRSQIVHTTNPSHRQNRFGDCWDCSAARQFPSERRNLDWMCAGSTAHRIDAGSDGRSVDMAVAAVYPLAGVFGGRAHHARTGFGPFTLPLIRPRGVNRAPSRGKMGVQPDRHTPGTRPARSGLRLPGAGPLPWLGPHRGRPLCLR